MAVFFEVDAEDIQGLDATQLTNLMECLISNELATSGLSRTNLYVSFDINVSDDGADAYVKLPDEPIPMLEHIPAHTTVFQAKSGKLTKSKFVDELFTPVSKKSVLKKRIKEVVDGRGAYMVFYGQTLKTENQNAARTAMLAAIAKVDPNAHPLRIEFIDCSHIARWCNQYLPAIIKVAKWSKRTSLKKFVNWDSWSRYGQFGDPFVPSTEADELISRIRADLGEPRKWLRLVGHSGLGKTRIALEALRPPSDPSTDVRQSLLSSSVAYVRDATVADIVDDIRELRDHGITGLLVADNCNQITHDLLYTEIVDHPESKMSLLSIDYHLLSAKSQPGELRLGRAKRDTLEKIIHTANPNLNPIQVQSAAQFADGFPRIAVGLSAAQLSSGAALNFDESGALTDAYLWGRRPVDEVGRKVIRALALFSSVGFAEGFKIEREYVAKYLCKMDDDEFFEKAKSFSLTALDFIGDFVRVSPIPMALRLVESWYANHDADAHLRLLTDEKMPPRLRGELVERFSHLGDSVSAKAVAHRLMDPNAPFGTAEVLNTQQGSRVFRSLAEVDPAAAATALVREFGSMTVEELEKSVGPGRRNLVWSLETIVFNKEQFVDGMSVLARFAVGENEKIGNNSRAEFVNRFHWMLAGTEAGPDLRLQVIDRLLASQDSRFVELGIRALGGALTEGNGRSGGSESQGGRTLKDWYPSTWAELFDYIDAALSRLVPFAKQSGEFGDLARSRITKNIAHVFRHRPHSLDHALRDIISDYKSAWPKAIDSVEWLLEHVTSDGDFDAKALVQGWYEILQPTDFAERVRLTISVAPRGALLKSEDGSYINTSQERAAEFVRELGPDIAAWKNIIDLISSGDQHQAFAFGLEMGKLVPLNDQVEFGLVALSAMELAESPNPDVTMGLFGGFISKGQSEVKKLFRNLASASPKVAKFAPRIMSAAGPDDEDLSLLLPLLNTQVLKPTDFGDFAFSYATRSVSPGFVNAFFSEFLKYGIPGAQSALHIMAMYTHGGNQEKWDAVVPLIRKIVVTKGLYEAKELFQTEHYSLEQMTKKLLLEPKGAKALAKTIAREIVRVCKTRRMEFSAYDVMRPIAFTLLKDHQEIVWPLFLKGISGTGGLSAFHFEHLLKKRFAMDDSPASALLYLTEDRMREWCESQPKSAPPFIALNVPIFEEKGAAGTPTPIAKMLIKEYGSTDHVLSAITSNIESFSNMGSLVPAYSQRLAFYRHFVSDPNPDVSVWAAEQVSVLEKRVERQRRRDEEMKNGIIVSPFADEM